MNCFRITRGIYYFENVLSQNMQMAVYSSAVNHRFVLDARAGSVEIKDVDPVLKGVFLMMREQMFSCIYDDDAEIAESFKYDASQFDTMHILAKGAQNKEKSHYHTDNNNYFQYSMIYYPHLRWDDEWGGSIKLGDKLEFYPKPNTALMFPCHLTHKIEPVNLNTEEWRVTCFTRTSNLLTPQCDLSFDLIKGAFDDSPINPTQVN